MASLDGVMATAVVSGLGKFEAENWVFGGIRKGSQSDSAKFEGIVGPVVTIFDLNI